MDFFGFLSSSLMLFFVGQKSKEMLEKNASDFNTIVEMRYDKQKRVSGVRLGEHRCSLMPFASSSENFNFVDGVLNFLWCKFETEFRQLSRFSIDF